MKAALLALGVILLIVGGVTAAGMFKFTENDKVADLGPIEIHKEKEHKLPLNAGYIMLGLGALMVVGGAAMRRS